MPAPALAGPPVAHQLDPRPRVLVVDDDDDIRMLVEFRLRLSGYDVEGHATAEAGLAACLARRPDVLLLDIVLPDMDGLEALRELRATPELADLPTVLLTARAGEAATAAGYAAGATAYVVKPFSPRALAAVVTQLVAPGRRPVPPR